MYNNQFIVLRFSTSDAKCDGFFRKTLRNFEKTPNVCRVQIVELFLEPLVSIGASESFVSKLPFAIVKRRFCSVRICSLIRICFNVPAKRSSTLSLIAADVSTNLQSCLIAACRAAKEKQNKTKDFDEKNQSTNKLTFFRY